MARAGARHHDGGVTELIELDVALGGGGVLHAYDTGGPGHPVLWHHGTPNTGHPPAPLFAVAERLGLRLVGYDRPGYGGSTPSPDRPVSSAATYAVAVGAALGLERFAVLGHSGGGPHALACAALLPDRVSAVVSVASLAPYDGDGFDGLDYTAGMCASGVAALSAAAAGREVKEAHDAAHGADYDPEFTDTDLAAFGGPWGWLGSVVRAAAASGPAPAIDDDLAYVRPWGFDVAAVTAPVLLLQGGRDRIVPPAHATWLAAHLTGAELREYPDDGHISVLTHGDDALAWLATAVS